MIIRESNNPDTHAVVDTFHVHEIRAVIWTDGESLEGKSQSSTGLINPVLSRCGFRDILAFTI